MFQRTVERKPAASSTWDDHGINLRMKLPWAQEQNRETELDLLDETNPEAHPAPWGHDSRCSSLLLKAV